ncbi:hypothetical protein GQX74_012538 [Glossina fuscipes]|nr:hypothetical protein GQX74_012538 [Glossina fuscipes]
MRIQVAQVVLWAYGLDNREFDANVKECLQVITMDLIICDRDRNGTNTQLAGCEVRFRNYSFDTYISIRYKNNILSMLTDMNRDEWKNCFVVNNVELTTSYFFSLSATSDDLSDNHDIFSFKFYDLDSNVTIIMARANIIPDARTFEPPREHKDDPKSSMSNAKIFFILLFGMLIAVGIAIFAISYFKEKNSRKRFYKFSSYNSNVKR